MRKIKTSGVVVVPATTITVINEDKTESKYTWYFEDSDTPAIVLEKLGKLLNSPLTDEEYAYYFKSHDEDEDEDEPPRKSKKAPVKKAPAKKSRKAEDEDEDEDEDEEEEDGEEGGDSDDEWDF